MKTVIEFSMLSFRLLETDFRIGFGFLLVTAVSFMRPNGITETCLLFCFMHELGHLVAMRFLGARVTGVRFYGGGIGISADTECLSRPARLIIYSAGCISNLTFALIFYIIGKYTTSVVNLAIALFNLMPVSYFDGGMILQLIFPNGEKSLKIVSGITTFILILLFFASTLTVPAGVSVSQLMTLFAIIACELIDREV
ncbi:MAG: hypothetical protein LUF29_07755 [Oscillospiraceae bacterium]|nr:hypothetical protein [Oscillospiraceae bacterium]